MRHSRLPRPGFAPKYFQHALSMDCRGYSVQLKNWRRAHQWPNNFSKPNHEAEYLQACCFLFAALNLVVRVIIEVGLAVLLWPAVMRRAFAVVIF